MSGEDLVCLAMCLVCCAPCPEPQRDPGPGPGPGERRDEKVRALEQRVALLEGLLVKGQQQHMTMNYAPPSDATVALIKQEESLEKLQ